MKAFLLITLAACGAYAVPVPDDSSAVDLVPPRRVITRSRAGPSYTSSMADTSDILRRLFGTSGFPGLVPRRDLNCDSGKFQLRDAVYDMVMQCQRSRSAEQELKQCIVDGLPDDAKELKEFLNRDEFSITGISSSFSIVIVDGEMTQKRSVTFQLCPPSDEVNTVEEEEDMPQFQPYWPSFPFRDAMRGGRPTFQMPDVFSRPNSFFNFDAFRPIFDMKPSDMFPSFPNFDFNPSGFPAAGYDPETCVKQTFQLPKEQFMKARGCLGSKSFQQCLSEKLSGSEEAKELLEFVGAEGMVVVDRRFFSSISSVNGVVTQKRKIQLTHCQEAEAEEAAGEEEQQEAETTPQQTPQQTTDREQNYRGEDFEP